MAGGAFRRHGWDGYHGTVWYHDPAEDLTAIFAVQRAHAGDQSLPMGGTSGPPSTGRSTTVPRRGLRSGEVAVGDVGDDRGPERVRVVVGLRVDPAQKFRGTPA